LGVERCGIAVSSRFQGYSYRLAKLGGRRRELHGTAEGGMFSLDAASGQFEPAFGRERLALNALPIVN
jgi:hypothetical protein